MWVCKLQQLTVGNTLFKVEQLFTFGTKKTSQKIGAFFYKIKTPAHHLAPTSATYNATI
jgi:hypothetical protein